MRILRTPDKLSDNLADCPFAPRYTEIEDLHFHHVEQRLPESRSGADAPQLGLK